MAEFKTGDRVTLNVEGCPCMTVSAVRGPDVTCRWFGKDGAFHEHTFNAAELTAECKPEAKPVPVPVPVSYHTKEFTVDEPAAETHATTHKGKGK